MRGGSNQSGGSGSSEGRFLELGSEFLKTSLAARHEGTERLDAVRVAAEETRRALGIYHPERAWFVVQGDDAAAWECSLTPVVPILRDLFNDPAHVSSAVPWQLYLEAFRLTFVAAQESNVLLDCNPNNFGLLRDRLIYVDDDLVSSSGLVPLGTQLLLRLSEYEHAPLTVRRGFLEGFAGLVETHLGDLRLREGLLADLELGMTWPRDAELRSLLDRIVSTLSQPRGESP